MVARNIAAHIERWVQDKPREWQPLVYCWRGGQRSGSLAWFLDQIGFRTTRLNGGYKAFRSAVRDDLADAAAALQLTRDRRAHRQRQDAAAAGAGVAGAQVLDLEGAGLSPRLGARRPARHAAALAKELRHAAVAGAARLRRGAAGVRRKRKPPRRPLQLPDALVARMREHARCVRVQMDDRRACAAAAAGVRLLRADSPSGSAGCSTH